MLFTIVREGIVVAILLQATVFNGEKIGDIFPFCEFWPLTDVIKQFRINVGKRHLFDRYDV